MISNSELRAKLSLPPNKGIALVVLAAAGAVLLGGLVPSYGVDLIWALAAGAAAVVLLLWPMAGFYLLLAIIPLESLVLFEGDITWVRILGLAAFGSWVLHRMVHRASWTWILSVRILGPALLWLFLSLVSALWAQHLPSLYERIPTSIQLVVFSLFVIGACDSWIRSERAFIFLVLGGVVASVVTIQQFVSHDQVGFAAYRAGQVTGNSNDTAATLVVIIPLAVFLFQRSSLSWGRIVGLIYIVVAPVAIILTFSRAGLIMLLFIVGVLLLGILADKNAKRTRFILVGLIVAAALFSVVPWEEVQGRASSIVPYLLSPDAGGDASGSRVHHWRGAVAMFTDYPVLGVGYGNFGYQFLRYQHLVPNPGGVYFASLRVPHSTYLGILAELGLVGMALWIWLYAIGFHNLARARSLLSQFAQPARSLFVRATFYSLLVYTLYGLPQGTLDDKLLWVVFGFTEVSRRLALVAVDTLDKPLTTPNMVDSLVVRTVE